MPFFGGSQKSKGNFRGVHNFDPTSLVGNSMGNHQTLLKQTEFGEVETTGPTIPRDPSALFHKIFLGKPPPKDENKLLNSTLPRTNIARENMVFQKETSIPTIHFQELFSLVNGHIHILSGYHAIDEMSNIRAPSSSNGVDTFNRGMCQCSWLVTEQRRLRFPGSHGNVIVPNQR